MKKRDIDFARLAADMRRAAEALDRVSRRRVPVEELLLDALGSLGPLSAYRLVKVTRRGRANVYAGLRALEAAGRIKRTRSGWSLVDERASGATDPGVLLQTERPSETTEPPRQ